jgi:acetyl-CoA synthetase
MYQRSIADPDAFWAGEAKDRVHWRRDFDTTSNVNLDKGHIEWFTGGELNVSENCIDRHCAERGDQVAILYEGDETDEGYEVTYTELLENVSRLANVLKDQGVQKGDVVTIYMPMTPYVAYAMLACARIGAVHSVVFAGFSAAALQARILTADCKTVITADEGMRGGKAIPLKSIVDDAIVGTNVSTVLVQSRTGSDAVAYNDATDIKLEPAMAKARPTCPPTIVNAEDPLFILYTSGSTGTPKGLMHTSGGYATYASMTHEHIFDYKEGDIYACVADAGWITGHTYVVYGPLLNGATTVMFESIPTYPDPGRYWEMVERLKINQFYTAPTALRLLIKSGNEWVDKYDLSSLKLLGTVGEPINPDAWNWYNEVVGKKNCTIVDTWWQTETGGIMMTPLPGDTDTKPGSCMRPFFGVEPVLLDPDMNVLEGDDQSGALCIKTTTPGMSRTVFGDHERFKSVYYENFPGFYETGDGAMRDADGHYWITGRVDDVLNVSGHRLGTAEIESALVDYEGCAEAAVVGFPHEIKGQGIYAYVTMKDDYTATDESIANMAAKVREIVGPFAKPDVIQLAPGLPKTRSGKIMRRVLRKIAADDYADLGDTSTLSDPAVVEDLISGRVELRK